VSRLLNVIVKYTIVSNSEVDNLVKEFEKDFHVTSF
jgi:hypothetical protein